MCNPVNLFLFNFFFQDNHGIVKIAPSYESKLIKRFKLVEKNECAAFAYFLFKIIYRIQNGILVPQDLRIVVDKDVNAEMVIRINNKINPVFFVGICYFLLYDKIIPLFLSS
jgi:hypothetical protein